MCLHAHLFLLINLVPICASTHGENNVKLRNETDESFLFIMLARCVCVPFSQRPRAISWETTITHPTNTHTHTHTTRYMYVHALSNIRTHKTTISPADNAAVTGGQAETRDKENEGEKKR